MERIIRKIEPTFTKIPVRKRVAAYARVSCGKDTMLHSLSAQISYYSSYIQKEPGWEYIGVYADEATSGTKDGRKEFQRLLSDCREGKVDMIITKSISRFARNTVTMLETVRELRSLNIDVYFEKENIHSISGDGELMLTILASFAQEESLSVSENCKWRIKERFKQGELINFELYGYTFNKGKIEINQQEAGIVRMVFADYLDGNSVEEIADKLAKLGIQRPRGGEWKNTRVLEMLKNEKYTGNALLQKTFRPDHLTKKRVRNNGELAMYYAEETHPEIIDTDTFQRVKELIENKRIKSNIAKRPPADYPLTSKIICKNCGKKYYRKVRNGKVFWQCTTYLHSGKEACNAKQIPEYILMATIAEVLGLNHFDNDIFNERIIRIEVPGPNLLDFIFKDEHVERRQWHDYSRSESWDTEARRKASEKQKEYIKGRKSK